MDGIRISSLDLNSTVELLEALAYEPTGSDIHLCNAHTFNCAAGDPDLKAALQNSVLNLPDGASVHWCGRLRGIRGLEGPVRGPALMMQVLRRGVRLQARHAFYGGSPETISALEVRLPVLVPGIKIVSLDSPPFRPLSLSERDALIEKFEALRPDYVWIGLGTPKQDFFVAEMSRQVPSVFIAVGAALNFAGGTVKEAPRLLHGSGLEWVYRLWREPRRLWRRYLIGNPKFILFVLRDCLSEWRS